MRKVRETYRITRHDIQDNLGIYFDGILEVKILLKNPGHDEECLEITVEISKEED